jgi:hypothetical protein
MNRVTIRIVATITHCDNLLGFSVDYMGARFMAPPSSLIEHVEPHMALFELDGRIIRPTGRASFLVDCHGRELRVHVQQMRPIESEVAA